MLKQRNSSIELLRILCMMFIVMHHIIITTIAPNFVSPVYNFLDMVFHTAVVIFVIITGYFGIKFKLGRLLRLWLQLAYYSILIGCIAYFVLHTISLKELADCALPVYRKPYWFMSTYIELFLVSPALNVIVKSLSRRQLLLLILVLLYSNNAFPADLFFDSGLLLFSLLYLTGRYIGLYLNDSLKSNTEVLFLVGAYVLLSIPFFLLHPETGVFQKFISFSYRYYGIGTILLSILFFYFFKNITFHNKAVNYAAASVLSIYLIHENHLISHYVYELPVRYLMAYLPAGVVMFFVAFCIVLSCICIDQIRILFFRFAEPLFLWMEKLLRSFETSVLKALHTE